MKEIIWLVDLHLDAVDPDSRELFFEKLQREKDAACILVGGDTADGAASLFYLQEIKRRVEKPVYFILGNHDFYGLSIDVQKKRAIDLAHREQNTGFRYLTYSQPIELTPHLGLVGHDSWADGQEGTFMLSMVCLRDYFEIEELKARTPQELQAVLKELGEEAACDAEKQLKKAFEQYEKVIFLTHAPPFREACYYQEQISTDYGAPHFVAKAMGTMLKRLLLAHPHNECLVLAGHTHHRAKAHILANLEVRVAQAEYGEPEIQKILI